MNRRRTAFHVDHHELEQVVYARELVDEMHPLDLDDLVKRGRIQGASADHLRCWKLRPESCMRSDAFWLIHALGHEHVEVFVVPDDVSSYTQGPEET